MIGRNTLELIFKPLFCELLEVNSDLGWPRRFDTNVMTGSPIV